MEQVVKVVLVDDEYSALKGLQNKLRSNFPELRIEETFQDPSAALSFLKKSPPDILFLDIQMPGITGFELLTQLKHVDFQVIFATAYSEFALKALKLSAVDYILKPIDDDDLITAVNKALANIRDKNQELENKKLMSLLSKTVTNSHKIVIPTTDGISFINADDVKHIEGYEGYTRFHLDSGETIVSSYNLGRFEEKLDPEVFFKCHKSHIVHIGKVVFLEKEGSLILEGDYPVPISKRKRRVFLEVFQ